MLYTLVTPDGLPMDSRHFSDEPPTLSHLKGRWIKNIPPTYNSSIQQASIVVPIPPTAVEVPYVVEYKDIQTLQVYMLGYLEDDKRIAESRDVIVNNLRFAADDEARQLISQMFTHFQSTNELIQPTIITKGGTTVDLTAELLTSLYEQTHNQELVAQARLDELVDIILADDATPELICSVTW